MRYKRDSSAGFIVFHRDEGGCRFLLVLSRQTKRPLWEFPKGGINPGETVESAALRELREETGLHGDDIVLLDGFRRSERYRFTVQSGAGQMIVIKQVTYFLAEARHTRVKLAAAEAMDHGWFELPEAVRRVRYRDRRRILNEAAAFAGCVPPGTEDEDPAPRPAAG
ncbi:MAG TPA: NUDIX domain-containing protein [Longimicrobiales bacterium]|nr:NUDIX domain-containing protein [Longimicrobiales bacterium]